MLEISPEEQAQRDRVMRRILEDVRENRRILLPDFDRDLSRPSDAFALVSVGLEPNAFGGAVGEYRYQFEGEEDLLHLIVTRTNQSRLSPEEAREVASFLLAALPPGLVWLRPGEFSQHFYFGHDELLTHLRF